MIRIANENDREIWLELRRIVYEGCSEDFHQEDINIWLRDPDKVCFLLEVDGKVAGFLEAFH